MRGRGISEGQGPTKTAGEDSGWVHAEHVSVGGYAGVSHTGTRCCSRQGLEVFRGNESSEAFPDCMLPAADGMAYGSDRCVSCSDSSSARTRRLAHVRSSIPLLGQSRSEVD